MYVPYSQPPGRGRDLHGGWTLLGLGLGAVVCFIYEPTSFASILLAGVAWILGGIAIHWFQDGDHLQAMRIAALLLGAPLALLVLNGLLDTYKPIEVPAVVSSVTTEYTRRGRRTYAEVDPTGPDAPFEHLNRSLAMEFGGIHKGTPVLVRLGHGAFGLPWIRRVEFNPARPEATEVP